LKRALVGALLTATLGAASCDQMFSLNSLFADGDLALEPGLVGVWRDSGSTRAERWVILRPDSSQRNYTLVFASGAAQARAIARIDFENLMRSDSATRAMLRRDPAARARRARDSILGASLVLDTHGPRVFDVQVGRVAGALFLDLSPGGLTESPRLDRKMMIPAHWFWRAVLDGDRLELTPLDAGWLGTQIDSGRVNLSHVMQGESMILTATSRELQDFIGRFAQDTAAFPKGDAERLIRMLL